MRTRGCQPSPCANRQRSHQEIITSAGTLATQKPQLPTALVSLDPVSFFRQVSNCTTTDLGVMHRDWCVASLSASVRPSLPPRTVVLAVFPAHGGTAQRCVRKNRVYATSPGIRTAENRD